MAEDHPDMWQKIIHLEKYIFQQAAMKISTPFQTKPSHILKIAIKNFQVFGSITFSFRGARSALPTVFVGERGSKVSQFAKNAPLNALIILARDEHFYFGLIFQNMSKGWTIGRFLKKDSLWLFFVAKLSLSPS